MISLGLRVSVKGKTGVVRFIGRTQFAPGVWVGIELTEPNGRNNGTIDGVEYFKCQKEGLYGLFALESIVEPIEAKDVVKGKGAKEKEVKGREAAVIERLQNKLQMAISEIKQYKNDILELQAQIERFKSMEEKFDEIMVDRDFLSEENKTISQNLVSLQNNYDLLKKELSAVKEELEINKELEDELKLVSSDTDDVGVLVQKNKKLELALANLKGVADSKELELSREISQLKTALDAGISKQVYSALVLKLDTAETTISELKSQLESIDNSSQIIDKLTTENDQLTGQISSLKAQVDELVELQQLDKDMEDYHGRIEQDLRQQIHELEKKVVDERKLKHRIDNDRKELSNKLLNLRGTEQEGKVGSIDSGMMKKFETQALELNRKSHDLKYTELLLNMSQKKLSVYPNKKQGVLYPLEFIKDFALLGSSNTFSVAEKIKLCQLAYSLEYLQRVGEITEFDGSVMKMIDDLVAEILGCIKDDILVTFGVEKVERLVVDLVKSIDSNKSFNKACVCFVLYEWAVVDHFMKTVALPEERIVLLKKNMGELRSKIELLSRQDPQEVQNPQEVLQRYDIQFESIRCLLSQVLGTFEFGLEENMAEDDYKIINTLNEKIMNYKTELNTDLTPILTETQVPIKSETPSTNFELELNEKSRMIDDLQLTLQLLENNMSNTTVTHKSKLQHLNDDLTATKDQHALLKQEYDDLKAKNKSLEAQVEMLISSGKYFDASYVIGRFDNLNAEKAFVDNVKLVEEITYLRKLVGTKSVEGLEWLQTPRTQPKKVSDLPNILTVSRHIQKIAKSVEILPITRGEWVRKHENPKFILSTIDYQLRSYENERKFLFE